MLQRSNTQHNCCMVMWV